MVNQNIVFTFPHEREFTFSLGKCKHEFQGSVFWVDPKKIYPKYIRMTPGGYIILVDNVNNYFGILVTTAYLTPNSHHDCVLLSDCKVPNPR